MWFLGRGPERVPSSAPPTARFRETFDQVTTRPRSLLCRGMRSPLATLVHQGSDPTLPHQALGDPTERQAFLEGVKAPRCQKALFGPQAIAVRWGRSPLTYSILPSSPPVGVRPRAGSHSGDAAR